MFIVYMVAADDAKDHATVLNSGFIDLGVIKGNIGDQNYSIGPDVNLSKYRTVSVWCKRFSVNFGAAALTPDHTVSGSIDLYIQSTLAGYALPISPGPFPKRPLP